MKTRISIICTNLLEEKFTLETSFHNYKIWEVIRVALPRREIQLMAKIIDWFPKIIVPNLPWNMHKKPMQGYAYIIEVLVFWRYNPLEQPKLNHKKCVPKRWRRKCIPKRDVKRRVHKNRRILNVVNIRFSQADSLPKEFCDKTIEEMKKDKI